MMGSDLTSSTKFYELENSDELSQILNEAQEKSKKIAVLLDFDGVLASDFEHRIYKADENETCEQTILLKQAADIFHINHECIISKRYIRHLVYQAAAHELGLPIRPGQYISIAKWCDQHHVPWFVLTARSGMAAVKRLYHFLDDHSLKPLEIYDIGRVAKTEQLLLILRDKYSVREILFVDDEQNTFDIILENENILKLLQEQNSDGSAKLSLYLAKNSSMDKSEEQSILDTCYEQIQCALKTPSEDEDFEKHKSALENSWRHFQHYANQRLITFRYMLLIMVAVMGGYIQVLLSEDPNQWLLLTIGGVSILFILLFWGLEHRNEQLVDASEEGLKVGEKKYACSLRQPALQIIKATGKYDFITYSIIMRLTYFTLLILSYVGTLRPFLMLVDGSLYKLMIFSITTNFLLLCTCILWERQPPSHE